MSSAFLWGFVVGLLGGGALLVVWWRKRDTRRLQALADEFEANKQPVVEHALRGGRR